ncbi:hypothetical protein MN116_008910 [Schistosoma mekongi]|uniref:Uncharacterized protein n=1 Tax=Schistosoma mekongi TaxID=38744 RepID=A0AAE2D1C1_SCHME|nr:hypothetical protein MN116_008910 [Schistosoma mekongi]
MKGYDLLKRCDYVYLDSYTSIFPEEFSGLDISGKCILPADREFVGQGSEILDRAKDHDVKERSLGNILRDGKIYEPPRSKSCCEAVHQLLEVINAKASIQISGTNVTITKSCIVICLSRIGSDDQKIVVSTISDIDETHSNSAEYSFNFGGPPHCVIIPGMIHELESDFLSARYRLGAENQTYLPTFYAIQKHNSDILRTIQDTIRSHSELVCSMHLKPKCI